jgi:hypothetical protein
MTLLKADVIQSRIGWYFWARNVLHRRQLVILGFTNLKLNESFNSLVTTKPDASMN